MRGKFASHLLYACFEDTDARKRTSTIAIYCRQRAKCAGTHSRSAQSAEAATSQPTLEADQMSRYLRSPTHDYAGPGAPVVLSTSLGCRPLQGGHRKPLTHAVHVNHPQIGSTSLWRNGRYEEQPASAIGLALRKKQQPFHVGPEPAVSRRTYERVACGASVPDRERIVRCQRVCVRREAKARSHHVQHPPFPHADHGVGQRRDSRRPWLSREFVEMVKPAAAG